MSWRSAGSFSVRHRKICPCCCNSDPIIRIPRISQEHHQITTRIAVTSHHIQLEAGAWKSHIEQIYISMTSCFKYSPYYKYNFKIPIRAAAIWVLKAKSGFSLPPTKANPNSYIHYCEFLGFKGFEVGVKSQTKWIDLIKKLSFAACLMQLQMSYANKRIINLNAIPFTQKR